MSQNNYTVDKSSLFTILLLLILALLISFTYNFFQFKEIERLAKYEDYIIKAEEDRVFENKCYEFKYYDSNFEVNNLECTNGLVYLKSFQEMEIALMIYRIKVNK